MKISETIKKVYDKVEYLSTGSGLPRPNIIKQINIVD